MTLSEYEQAVEQIPKGPLGPLGGARVYRITVASRPARPALARRPGESDAEQRQRERFARHAADAQHDRVVRRLRALADRDDSPQEFRRQLRLRGSR